MAPGSTILPWWVDIPKKERLLRGFDPQPAQSPAVLESPKTQKVLQSAHVSSHPFWRDHFRTDMAHPQSGESMSTLEAIPAGGRENNRMLRLCLGTQAKIFIRSSLQHWIFLALFEDNGLMDQNPPFPSPMLRICARSSKVPVQPRPWAGAMEVLSKPGSLGTGGPGWWWLCVFFGGEDWKEMVKNS